MNLTRLRPFVPSGDNFELSRQFFIDIGFKGNWGNEGLCELQLGDVIFLLQSISNKALQENYMLQVETDDLDGFYNHLVSLNLSEKYEMIRFSEPEDRPWGIRELHLIDPGGVCWHFT